MECPFIIYALPRSRTAWLADFLTYRDWKCLHETAIFLRETSEIPMLLNLGKIGVVETAAAPGHWLIEHYVPGILSVVVRRPTDDVIASMLAIDLEGVATYDVDALRRIVAYGNRMLDAIARRPGTLVVEYADLDRRDVCASIFEYCLPYQFDESWWERKRRCNVQVDVKQYVAYYHQNRNEVDGFKRKCKSDLRRLAKAGLIVREFA